MTRVAVSGSAAPPIVAAIVAALGVRARDGAAISSPAPSRSSAWRRAARREALRTPRP